MVQRYAAQIVASQNQLSDKKTFELVSVDSIKLIAYCNTAERKTAPSRSLKNDW